MFLAALALRLGRCPKRNVTCIPFLGITSSQKLAAAAKENTLSAFLNRSLSTVFVGSTVSTRRQAGRAQVHLIIEMPSYLRGLATPCLEQRRLGQAEMAVELGGSFGVFERLHRGPEL